MKNIIKKIRNMFMPKHHDVPYPLQQFHLNFIKSAKNDLDFRCKRVLEIGGSNFPASILFKELKVKKWVCVDYVDFWAEKKTPSAVNSEKLVEIGEKTGAFAAFALDDSCERFNDHKYLKFYGDASNIPTCFYNQFDIVVSNDAFEHIAPLPDVINKIYHCLRAGGHFYSFFASIYSGSVGHHYRLDDRANFGTVAQDGIPPFAHLIWSESEMREYFGENQLPFGQIQLDALCDWAYHNDGISRRVYSDYVNIMEKSLFNDFEIIPEWTEAPDEKTLKILNMKYPDNKIWANGIWIKAVK